MNGIIIIQFEINARYDLNPARKNNFMMNKYMIFILLKSIVYIAIKNFVTS